MKLSKDDLKKLINNSNEAWYKNPAIKFDTATKLLNMRFRSGDQWIGFDKEQSRIVPLPYDQNIPAVTANLFKTYTESVKSRILSLNPRARVVPMSRDWTDWTTALNYTKFYKGIFNAIDFEDYLQDMADIQQICGGVWIRPFWNKDIQQGKFRGEVDFDVRHDITAVVDPVARRIKDVRYIDFIEVYACSAINEAYGKDFKPDNMESVFNGWYATVFSELQKARNFNLPRDLMNISSPIVVSEFFYLDKDNKPRVAIFAKGEILDDYAIDFFPTYIPLFKNGMYWKGMTSLDDLRCINRELNYTLTRIKGEYSKVAKTLYNVNEIEFPDDRDTLDYDSSEMVPFMSSRPGAVPLQWVPPPGKTIDLNVYLNMWGEVGGQNDASRGKVPTSQAAGILVESLVNQDDTKIGNAKTNFKVGLRKVFRQIKTLVDKYYTEDRVVAVAGRERGWESFCFKDFKERTSWFNMDIEIGSALPTTSGSKINVVMRLVQMGIFNDLQNPMKHARDLMDLSVFEVDIVDQDVDKQNVEIEQILTNKAPKAAQDYDDHITHI
ncbi:MAG: hypothetical protein WC763_07495, partial [Candidatus Paceibacterota bacterium]